MNGDPTFFSSGNYLLSYNKHGNYIFINLPQTKETAMNTVDPIEQRRVDISGDELMLLLNIVRLIFERRTNNEPEDIS